jgi:hypothetical protein
MLERFSVYSFEILIVKKMFLVIILLEQCHRSRCSPQFSKLWQSADCQVYRAVFSELYVLRDCSFLK